MPITLPVVATADNRSFDRIGNQAEKHFGKAGQDAGKAFAKGLDDAASKADPKAAERWTKAYDKVADATGKVRVEEAKLADLRQKGASDTRLITQSEALERARRAEVRATRDAANAYQDLGARASGLGSSLVDLASGTRFGGMIADTQRLSQSFGGIGLAVGGAITGVAALAVGIGAAATKLYELGARWDDVADSITVRTGLMGDELAAVMDQVSRVALDSTASISQIGDIAAQVTALMGVSGDQVGELTAYLADLNEMQGQQTNIRELAMLYRVFRVDAQDQIPVLNELNGVFLKTQVPVNELISTLVKAGPVADEFGLSIGQTAGLLAQFAEAGVEPEKAVTGLTKALASFAKDGKSAKAGLAEVITEIQALTAAGKDTEAQQVAIGTFGTKNFTTFLTAIQQGRISVDQLNAGLEQTDLDIRDLKASTDDFSQTWDKFVNNLQVIAKPAADGFFSVLNSYMQQFIDLVKAFQSPELRAIPGVSTQTYPGQVIAPTTPSPGGGIAPPATGAIQGNGTFLENMLDGAPGVAAPPGLTGTPNSPGIGGPDTGPGPGGGGSNAVVLPYPAQYGQPPMPGESDQQYQARMADIMADHNLAQAQARVDQLKAQGNAEQSDIISAENALIEARMRAAESERRYVESMMPQAQGITVPFDPRYGQGPRPGQTAEQYANESKLLEARQKSAQAAAEYEQLMASGTATASELTKAHNDLVAALRDENEVSMRLSETSTKTTQQLGDIGAQLDADFGFSRGLPGIAENLTKFLANLAFAPVLGALKGVEAAGGYDEKTMGSGLAGMIGGALGLGKPTAAAAATGPQLAAGPQRPITSQQQFLGGAATGIDAALLARVPAGRYTQEERGDLTQGLADCTSSIEDLVNILDGRPTGGASLSTSNADQWLLERGFMPNTTGAPVPGAFNVGFWDGPGNQGHMQATLPDGTNFNWGSNASAANRGIGGTGAFDPAMTSQYYRPVSGMPTSSVAAMPRSATLSGLPLPLPVTIVGGMGSGPLATPAPASGGPASTSTPTTAATPGGGYAPLTPSQLTSPGLTTPTPLGGGGIGSGAGLPGLAGAPQAGGGSGLFGMLGSLGGGGMAPAAGAPGVGAPAGMPGTVGGTSPGGGPGGGGFGGAGSTGIGGMAMQGIQAGISAAGMALDATMPGAGTAAAMAANIGVQLGNRAIGQAGKAGGLLVGGIMETLLPSNSPLSNPNANWFGRIAAGFAGAKPALPNMTGQPADRPQGQQADPLNDPAAAGKAASSSSSSQSGVTVNYNNYQATEDRAGADLTNHLVAMNAAPGI